jgi:hypothetical protein
LHDGQAEETLLVGWKPRAAGGKCKVNWQRVCRPKQFGITDLERFGRALRLRWLWGQWKHPDKPWCNSEIPVDDIDQALFAAATKVTIHNGYTAKFWTTHWAHGNSLVSVFPALFSHSRKKNRTIAEAMAGDTWIKDLMHNVTPNIVADYIRLWMVIGGLNFDPSDTRSDEIVWLWSASGEYTAKSAYRMEFQGSTRSNFRALIWQVWAPSRCKFSIWLMLQNRV